MLGNYESNPDRIPEGIKILSKEKAIYLYGNSNLAENIINTLDKFHIALEGILVSKEYYKESEFHHIAVYEAEDFIENAEKEIVLIAGFHIIAHKELTDKLLNEKMIKTIYVLNGAEMLFQNDFHFFAPKIFLIDNYYEGLIKRGLDYDYFKDNYEEFLQTYNWLEDSKSKKTMEDYLRGHIELIGFPMKEVWEIDDVKKQYFPEDVIQLTDNEVFVDCGAYTGDTLECFLRMVNSFKKYYALEPDVRRFEELKTKLKEGVIHVPVGAWDKKEQLFFSIENECGEVNSSGELSIDVDKVDNAIDKNDKVTFIKMDIEGAELAALHGAEEIIRKDKPKLAICVYHKREDLITIPQYIKSIVPEYKLYLRAHFLYASEVVLYAVCD